MSSSAGIRVMCDLIIIFIFINSVGLISWNHDEKFVMRETSPLSDSLHIFYVSDWTYRQVSQSFIFMM